MDYRKNIREMKQYLDGLVTGVEVVLGKTINPTDQSTLQSVKGILAIFIAMNDNIASLREGIIKVESRLTVIEQRLKSLEAQLGDLGEHR